MFSFSVIFRMYSTASGFNWTGKKKALMQRHLVITSRVSSCLTDTYNSNAAFCIQMWIFILNSMNIRNLIFFFTALLHTEESIYFSPHCKIFRYIIAIRLKIRTYSKYIIVQKQKNNNTLASSLYVAGYGHFVHITGNVLPCKTARG